MSITASPTVQITVVRAVCTSPGVVPLPLRCPRLSRRQRPQVQSIPSCGFRRALALSSVPARARGFPRASLRAPPPRLACPCVSAPAPNPGRPSVRRAPGTPRAPAGQTGQSPLPGPRAPCPGEGGRRKLEASRHACARRWLARARDPVIHRRTDGRTAGQGPGGPRSSGRKYSHRAPPYATAAGRTQPVNVRAPVRPRRPMPTTRRMRPRARRFPVRSREGATCREAGARAGVRDCAQGLWRVGPLRLLVGQRVSPVNRAARGVGPSGLSLSSSSLSWGAVRMREAAHVRDSWCERSEF